MYRGTGELISMVEKINREDPSMTYSAISRLFQCSRERIRQIFQIAKLPRPTNFRKYAVPKEVALIACDGCGVDFERRTPSKSGRRQFHSRDCYKEWKSRPSRMLQHSLCALCGVVTATPPRAAYRPRYCLSCYNQNRSLIWGLNQKEAQGELTATATTTTTSH